MTRPRDFLHVLENDDAEAISVEDTGGALLLHLLVHMFFADRELHEDELNILRRLVGGDTNDELRQQVTQLNKLPMHFKKLAEVYPDREDRLDIITLAEHGFWGDNQMKFAEMDVLDKLADVLDVKER